ncbi:hypothetical protein BIS12_17690, partial [Halomonas sp. 707D7]|nr:hypothetical protein [Halomonas sp. 707D7]
GNVSGFGEAGAISVVITSPAAPTPSRAGGPVSSETTVEVDGIAEGATWEYTLDGGQTWVPGTGESFTLPEGDYAAGDIRVRQTDGAGNVSVGAPLGAVVIDLTPPAAPTLTLSGEGPITNDGRIDVGGLEPGASWEYSLDGGANWQLGIGAGFTLPEGVYAAETILVRQTDAAGNLGPEVALEPVTIDITPPAAPTATLVADRAITNDGRVEVSDLETGARWEVSLDGGVTWRAGVGTGFTLVDGDYAAGDVRVRQIDPAGNIGPSAGLGAVVIDTLEPDAPTLVLVNDTGIVGDGRTADGTLRVQGLEPGANWEFSLDGGTTWQRGSGDRFTLPEGIYEGGAVQVRQFDVAGNVSPVADFGPIIVELEIIAPEEPDAPATPTLSLAEDTGAQDGITSNGVVNVAGLIEGATW